MESKHRMAKNDLYTHTAYLLSAIQELPIRTSLYDRLIAHTPELEDRAAIVEDALGDVYRQLALHSDAILQLTPDDRTRDLLGELGTLVGQQIELLRTMPQKSLDLVKSQSIAGKIEMVAAAFKEMGVRDLGLRPWS